MNTQINEIVGKIDRFRGAAKSEQSQLAAFEDQVNSDPRRSNLAKQEDIKNARGTSATVIDAARRGEEQYLKEARAKLMENAFHPGSVITSSDRLAFRDASDRVSSIDSSDEDKALAMYESAVQVNDRPMIALLAKRAYTAGMGRLLEAHMNQPGSSKDNVEALQYIDQVEQSISARLAFGFAYSGASQSDSVHMY